MATFNPAGHLAGAPRGSQADALDGVVPQMEAELRALSAPALRPPGDWPGEEGSKELAEAVGVLRQHIDARYDCTCSRCTALAVVLRDRDAQVHRGNEWKRYAELLQRGLLEIAKRSNHHRRTAEQRGAALRDLILAVVKFWGPPANIQDHSEATPAQAELLAALDRAEAAHAEVAL